MYDRVRFDAFEVDLASGELRKHGFKIRLQEKPFQILAALLEKPGKIVTREELHEKLWPEQEFGEFDKNLNNAINRLRTALNDFAEQPRFIETLRQRGYRFMGPVEILQDGPSSTAYVTTPSPPTAIDSVSPVVAREPVPWSPRPFIYWRLSALVFCILAALALPSIYVVWKRSHTKAQAESRPRRIVVLPFGNLSGDPSDEYLCDGLTEEMIARLSILNPGKLGVIARTSAMHYKGSTKTAKTIGAELGVDYLLESSVRRSGNRLRITTQLIDTRSEAHLWTGTYDRDFQDILDVQRDLALAIAHEIPMQVSSERQVQASRPTVVNTQAHELYLRGRYLWNKRRPPELRKAIDSFEQALIVDSQYAEAYSGLADSYALLASSGAITYRDGYPKAREMSLKALEIDGELAEAHTSLGFVRGFYDWQFAEAEKEFHRAIELNSNYATAHHWYGLFLSLLGRHAEAIAELEQANRLDPAFVAVTLDLAHAYRRAGQYEKAFEFYRTARELDPREPGSYAGMALIDEHQRKSAEAEKEAAEFARLTGQSLALEQERAWECLKSGQRERGQALLKDIVREARKRGQPITSPYIYALFGQRDKAIASLEKEFEGRPDWMITIKADPRLESLQSDPRFQDLLHRIGFPSCPNIGCS